MSGSTLPAVIEASHLAPGRMFLDRLCRRVDDDMLGEIALADYGQGVEAHFAALGMLRDRKVGQAYAEAMAWEPREVLELFRWSEYQDDRSGRRKRDAASFHRMRMFCCAVLLEAATIPANNCMFEGTNQTLIQMMESLAECRGEFDASLPEFLAWLIVEMPATEDEMPYFGVALAASIIRLRVESGRLGEGDARLVTGLIEACEADVRQYDAENSGWSVCSASHPDRWLLRSTFFDQRHDKWVALGGTLLIEAASLKDDGLRAAVVRLARHLTRDMGD